MYMYACIVAYLNLKTHTYPLKHNTIQYNIYNYEFVIRTSFHFLLIVHLHYVHKYTSSFNTVRCCNNILFV